MGAFALQFPQNISGTDTTAPMVAIKFADPNTNGLPIWGASGGGVTVVRRIKVTSPQQQGFYQMFWWARIDGVLDLTQGYWGMHPYPNDGTSADFKHGWEIATNTQDYTTFDGNTTLPPALPLADGTVFTQIMQVTRAGVSDKTLTFYPNASITTSPNFVSINVLTANYGEGVFTAPGVFIGDSPWAAPLGIQPHECFGGVLDAIKIITPVLTLADATLEGANFSKMVTAAGQSGIWWGKNGFDSVNDLTDNYGTGRTFIWHDTSNKGTLVPRLVSAGGFIIPLW